MNNSMTAYMSRLQLDPFIVEARRAVASVEAMHKATCRIAGTDRVSGRVLWRWEPELAPTALLQTAEAPDPGQLPPGFVMTGPPILMSAHLDRLESGLLIRYRITASPTRNIRVEGRHKTKQTAIRAPEIPQWWQQKASDAGLTSDSEPALTISNAKIKNAGIPIVRIDGYAQVQDPDRLRTAILNGIGRGKPYGCGLLTVQPLLRSAVEHA